MLSDYLLDQCEFDISGGGDDEGMIQKLQKHPLFSSKYANLERFAEQIGRTFSLENEDDVAQLNEALPGDIIHIHGKDWSTSKMGAYEEIRLGNQIIIREPIGSAISGEEWLVKDRNAIGIKVALHRAETPIEKEEEIFDAKKEVEIIVDWMEKFLKAQEDYITTAYVGHLCSKHFGININSYLKENGRGKLVEFLKNSRLGPRLEFRKVKNDPWNMILLE